MKYSTKFRVAGGLLAMCLSIAGCEEEGPAEKAGKKIDEAISNLGDAAEDAADEAEDAVEDAAGS
ncbi:MAG: hypothetical protein DWQ08_08655 [Proteobacteria bacterium]|nr:MAG: hypothetical protein DWQ08_08655 [Pseudomonadota bacterium]